MSRKDGIMNLRQALITRRDALRKALSGDLSMLKELRGQNSGELVDLALDAAQQDISSQLVEVESRELERVELALDRIKNGKFGICQVCGTLIPMARLNALPYAIRCIKCQREAERSVAASENKEDLDDFIGAYLEKSETPEDEKDPYFS